MNALQMTALATALPLRLQTHACTWAGITLSCMQLKPCTACAGKQYIGVPYVLRSTNLMSWLALRVG